MFEFMEPFVRAPFSKLRLGLYENGFFPVSEEVVRNLEQDLGHEIPSELRAFYSEVGEGRLQTGQSGELISGSHNSVIYPSDIPRLIDGTCEWMMPYTIIEPNTLPFFDRDVDLFLCLRPKSENPNAVYWMWGEKVSDSLVDFFQKLIIDPDWFNPSKKKIFEN